MEKGLVERQRDLTQQPTSSPKHWVMGWVSLQSGITQRDLNVKEAWAQGYTGRGIVVSILDDGIEKNHPDLAGNYVRRRGGESRGSPALLECPG